MAASSQNHRGCAKGHKLWNRRVSRVAEHPGEGRLTQPTAAFQPSQAEPLFVPQRRLSIFLSPVAKITVASTLHDGLSAREPYVGVKTLREGEVHAADHQESKLRLTQLLVELRIPASGDINRIGILRLPTDAVVEGVAFGERGKRLCHVLSNVRGFFRPPPLFAEATINIA